MLTDVNVNIVPVQPEELPVLDLIIRGGQLIDGTGGPRRAASVGIAGGRVVAIGDVDDPAASVIDADGRVVAPGFIDVHTHFDAQVFWDPTLSPSPLHGVTTVMGGNCGFSVAPLNAAAAGYLMRMLARVEGMPLSALETGVPWNWRTTGEYLDTLENRLAVNAGFMVGHSAIRRVVMGEAATEREATEDEIAAMARLLHIGLEAGGLGFSSTMAESHHDGEGRPVPSRHASHAELLALAAVCAEHPGTSLEFLPSVGPTFSDSTINLMAELSRVARRPLNWNLLVAHQGNIAQCEAKLSVGDLAARRGGKVVALAMPMRVASRLNFLTGVILDMLPGWHDAMMLPPDRKLQLLSDPVERRRLAELAAGPEVPTQLNNWAERRIVETSTEATERYRGRLVADIATEEGKEPFDALLDVVCADSLKTTFDTPMSATRADWEARLSVLEDPRALIGGSDAGAHLDMIGTFNYPTYLLAHAVREHELMTTERAVHLLTGAPARLYGLVDRGTITAGAAADVVIFDEDAIDTAPLTTRFDLPGGGPRLYAEGIGITHVVVNGTVIAEDGVFTEARPGAVLRSGRDTVSPSLL